MKEAGHFGSSNVSEPTQAHPCDAHVLHGTGQDSRLKISGSMPSIVGGCRKLFAKYLDAAIVCHISWHTGSLDVVLHRLQTQFMRFRAKESHVKDDTFRL
jgi:hypothetical protein